MQPTSRRRNEPQDRFSRRKSTRGGASACLPTQEGPQAPDARLIPGIAVSMRLRLGSTFAARATSATSTERCRWIAGASPSGGRSWGQGGAPARLLRRSTRRSEGDTRTGKRGCARFSGAQGPFRVNRPDVRREGPGEPTGRLPSSTRPSRPAGAMASSRPHDEPGVIRVTRPWVPRVGGGRLIRIYQRTASRSCR